MTEKIQKAIDKIDKEAEKLGGGQFMVIASHIIDNYLKSDINAEKILDENNTLSKCMNYCRSKAKEQAKNGFAMIDDETVYGWVSDYYGFEELQATANKIVDLFDVL